LVLIGLLAAAGALDEQWLSFSTEDLVVHFWKDELRPARLDRRDGLNLYLTALGRRAAELEAAFQRVEAFLDLNYDPSAQGQVYLFIYPSLESYQEASGCLICAANVGGFIAAFYPEMEELVRSREVNPIAVYLTRESSEYVILHELTHVLDFSLLPNYPPTFLLEGLATYSGYSLDGVPDEWQLGLGEQQVKLFLQDFDIELFRDYFVRDTYWKFTYEVGASFIRFLAARGGWERFLRFYSSLGHPYDQREELDQLFRREYGLGLAGLEEEWRARLEEVVLTENARAAYEFKLDQILIRYIFLRPLLAEREWAKELFEEARTLVSGQFNELAGAALRAYLADERNLLASPEAAAEALVYGEYLHDYVRSYHSDRPGLIAQFEAEFAALPGLYSSGRYAEFARLYWELVNIYTTWRI
jgi:hypothetical protein